MRVPPTRFPFALLALAATLASSAVAARADEIVVRDLETCAESTLRVHEIVSEDWAEVKYRERPNGAVLSLPTLTVVSISRSGKDKQGQSLDEAILELNRGNHDEAAAALAKLATGGWKTDAATGDRSFVPYSEGDPTGKGKRPTWLSEYSHFHFAKALLLSAERKGDKDRVGEALLAIDDLPVPGSQARSGGFLGRFAGGNSRFYGEAMWLKARALTALGRYDEATAAFQELHDAALKADLGPRWAYEGKLGPGLVAQAKGDLGSARQAFTSVGLTLLTMLKTESRGCLRQELGRFYSLARARQLQAMLEDAEKRSSPAAFKELSAFIEQGAPESLRKLGQSQGLAPAAVLALVSGARDPQVQAVALNAEGLCHLNESPANLEQALLAFKAVDVKHFTLPGERARALYYLAQTAQKAAQAAKAGTPVRAMYEGMAQEALRKLRERHADSPWANK
jgi:tetratricopeptide (TPR) repeat protein